jgi:hypothetical protein
MLLTTLIIMPNLYASKQKTLQASSADSIYITCSYHADFTNVYFSFSQFDLTTIISRNSSTKFCKHILCTSRSTCQVYRNVQLFLSVKFRTTFYLLTWRHIPRRRNPLLSSLGPAPLRLVHTHTHTNVRYWHNTWLFVKSNTWRSYKQLHSIPGFKITTLRQFFVLNFGNRCQFLIKFSWLKTASGGSSTPAFQRPIAFLLKPWCILSIWHDCQPERILLDLFATKASKFTSQFSFCGKKCSVII